MFVQLTSGREAMKQFRDARDQLSGALERKINMGKTCNEELKVGDSWFVGERVEKLWVNSI